MFFKIARIWATFILFGMGLKPKVKRQYKIEPDKSYVFIANHTSMTDIMLMLYVVKNPFVFVGKKELTKIPLFGYFYKRTCIVVDRSNTKSKQAVFHSAKEKITQGLSICIFPEGGVPDDESIVLDRFKDGAFRLAIQHNLNVVPLVFFDNKKRFSYSFFSGGPGVLRVNILKPITVNEQKDKKELKEIAWRKIHSELKA